MTVNGLDPEDLLAELLQARLDALEHGKDAAAFRSQQPSRLNPDLESDLDTARQLLQLGGGFNPRPDFVMRSRVKLVQRIRQETRSERGRRAPAPFFLIPRNRISRLAYQASLLILVLAVILGGTFGAAYAAQGAVPGNQLYALKLGLESARLALTAAPEEKIELRLAYAEERLEEAGQLSQQESFEHLGEALQDYQAQIDQVAALLEQQGGQEISGSMAAVMNGLTARIAAQTRVVQMLSVGAPEAEQAKVEMLARHLEQKSQQIETFIARHAQPAISGSPQAQTQSAAVGKKAVHTTGLDKELIPGNPDKPTKTEKPTNEPKPTKTEKPTDEPKPTKTEKPTAEPKPTKTEKPTKEPKP